MRGGRTGSTIEFDLACFLPRRDRRLKERDCFKGGKRECTRSGGDDSDDGNEGVRERELNEGVLTRCVETRSPRSVGAGLLLRRAQGNGVCAERGLSRE